MTRQEIKAKAREQLGGNIFSTNWVMALLALLIVSLLNSIIPGIAAIVLSGPLAVGAALLFTSLARGEGEVRLEKLFDPFTTDFVGTFLLGLFMTLFTALWTLLFIIPGVVKRYAYAMAPYIKADHPEMDAMTCIKESQKLMNGHKMDFFILQLSFIGWLIVGALCCGIGTLFVAPYMEASKANFYESIKA